MKTAKTNILSLNTLLFLTSMGNGAIGIFIMLIAKTWGFCSWKQPSKCDYSDIEGWSILAPGLFILVYSGNLIYKILKKGTIARLHYLLSIGFLSIISILYIMFG